MHDKNTLLLETAPQPPTNRFFLRLLCVSLALAKLTSRRSPQGPQDLHSEQSSDVDLAAERVNSLLHSSQSTRPILEYISSTRFL